MPILGQAADQSQVISANIRQSSRPLGAFNLNSILKTPPPQNTAYCQTHRLSAGPTISSARLNGLLLPNFTDRGCPLGDNGRLRTNKSSPPPCPRRRRRSPSSATHPDSRFHRLFSFKVGIIRLEVPPAPPDLFPLLTPEGKIRPQSLFTEALWMAGGTSPKHPAGSNLATASG